MDPAEASQLARHIQDRLANEPSDWNRRELVLALAALPTRDNLTGLNNALADSSSIVRQAACKGLGGIRSTQAIQMLGKTLTGDNDLDVRLAAARELGRHRRPEAVLALVAVLDDQDAALRHRAMRSLADASSQDFGGDANAWKKYAANLMMESSTPLESPRAQLAGADDGDESVAR